MTIAANYGMYVLGTTWQTHDSETIKSFNCTCLTELEFQCFHESIRTGMSMRHVECDTIEEDEDKQSKKYEFCSCKSRGLLDRCHSLRCRVIDPQFEMPERCDNKKCDAFGGLNIWMGAAKWGTIVGLLAVLIVCFSLSYAKRKSQATIDIRIFYILNMIAIVPPASVTYSMLTTEVKEYYAQLELNAWATIMATVFFGVPLCVSSINSFFVFWEKQLQTA